MRYETERNTPGTGTAAPPSRKFIGGGAAPPPGRPDGGGRPTIGSSMAACVWPKRRGRVESQARRGTASPVEGGAKTAVGETVIARAKGARLFDGPMDVRANCAGDPQTLWGEVSPRSRLEDPAGFGLELSEAGAAGLRAQREGRPAMAEPGLAPYKKKPIDSTPTWSSLTRAGSCCIPWSDAPGDPGDGLPCFISRGPIDRKFLRSRRSAFPPTDGGWAPISASRRIGASVGRRPVFSSVGFCVIFGDTSSSCGIGASPIEPRPWRSSSDAIDVAWVWSGFLPTVRSSIPTSTSGDTSSTIGCPITGLTITTSFTELFEERPLPCVAARRSCGRLSMLPNSRYKNHDQ